MSRCTLKAAKELTTRPVFPFANQSAIRNFDHLRRSGDRADRLTLPRLQPRCSLFVHQSLSSTSMYSTLVPQRHKCFRLWENRKFDAPQACIRRPQPQQKNCPQEWIVPGLYIKTGCSYLRPDACLSANVAGRWKMLQSNAFISCFGKISDPCELLLYHK